MHVIFLYLMLRCVSFSFFFQAEDGIRDSSVTGVQTCALPIFAEWRAEKIGMFDTKTEKFREWPVPTPYTAPYDVVLDRTGKVWTAGMNTDRVLRMDLETGDFTEYPLPSQTNIRRVFVDNATKP